MTQRTIEYFTFFSDFQKQQPLPRSRDYVEVQCPLCEKTKTIRLDFLKQTTKDRDGYLCKFCRAKTNSRGRQLHQDFLKRNGVETERHVVAKLVRFLRKQKRSCNDPVVLHHMGNCKPNVLWRLLRKYGFRDFTKYATSRFEQEIYDFLVTIGISPLTIKRNDRKILNGQELDLLIY